MVFITNDGIDLEVESGPNTAMNANNPLTECNDIDNESKNNSKDEKWSVGARRQINKIMNNPRIADMFGFLLFVLFGALLCWALYNLVYLLWKSTSELSRKEKVISKYCDRFVSTDECQDIECVICLHHLTRRGK